MRNVLAHEYLGVDIVMVWDTLQMYLEPLRMALKLVLAERKQTALKVVPNFYGNSL